MEFLSLSSSAVSIRTGSAWGIAVLLGADVNARADRKASAEAGHPKCATPSRPKRGMPPDFQAAGRDRNCLPRPVAPKGITVRNLITEFRQFILRGNVVDLAIGIIIGVAFTGVVQ